MPNYDEHISTIPHLDCNDPWFAWIFENIDYLKWRQRNSSPMIWLSGPILRRLDEVSSYIVHYEKELVQSTNHLVLSFFSSSKRSGVSVFVRTLLGQIVRYSLPGKTPSIIQCFLHGLADRYVERNNTQGKFEDVFKGRSSISHVERLLHEPMDALLSALEGVLNMEQRHLSIVVDGLDHVDIRKNEFIEAIRTFCEHVQQSTSKARIWITSQPLAESRQLIDGLPCIEYDSERKGSSAPCIESEK
jgi:hypothetical protein